MRRSAVTLALLALAGCGSTSYGGGSSAGTTSSSSAASSAASKADLKTANSSLGKVVVTADGRTVVGVEGRPEDGGQSAGQGRRRRRRTHRLRLRQGHPGVGDERLQR